MASDVTASVHAFVGHMNRGEVEAVADLLTDDAEFDAGPMFPHPYVGREAIQSMFSVYLRSLPQLHLMVRDIFVNGSDVLVTVEIHASMGENPDPEHLPTWRAGQKISWRGAFLFSIAEDTLIRSVRFFGDVTAPRSRPG